MCEQHLATHSAAGPRTQRAEEDSVDRAHGTHMQGDGDKALLPTGKARMDSYLYGLAVAGMFEE